ncbi:flavin reductase [Microvirga sp. TS319]|uniref:flavin reductase n=1 Tax=Microvirga sp. TS319 TaxID=3241165 RepID=UPI00351A9809
MTSTVGIDSKSFRQALGAFPTGVTIVSTLQEDGQPRGFTANSFTSVSLDPPLVLVCIGKTASSYPVFSEAPHFSVTVLAESQKDVSSLFASKSPDKFSSASWQRGPAGSPVIEGAAAWFDCRRHQVVDAGDHIILIGEVVGFSHSNASPLGYCRGAYLTFSLSQDAVAAAGHRTLVGAILEKGRSILFLESADGSLQLPTGNALGPVSNDKSLHGVLRRLGIEAELNFLFAVFEDPRAEAGSTSIYYRGSIDGVPADETRLRLVGLDEIPWDRIKDEAVRSMLGRFVREQNEDTFGIYVGDADHGTVKALAS